ncbi:uncharacterized protein [Panulirus ornatus]|uniref:uncharacterized protein n=1 Tax=Panulirus ornatus TaxID=150431 RepID=UPI003A88D760
MTPTTPPWVPGNFHVEDSTLVACVVSGVTTLVCGVVASAGVFLGKVPRGTTRRLTGTRVLLCSYVAAGLIHLFGFTPILLAAVVHNNRRLEIESWACSVGWLAWTWAWAVQVVGVVSISYERYRAVTRPMADPLATRLALLLAGLSWVCGGVVAVLVAGGLPHSVLKLACAPAIDAHHPDLDFLKALVFVVTPGGLLGYCILGYLWVRTIVVARRQGCILAGNNDEADRKASDVGVGSCGRSQCPCHGEVELVTVSRSSGAFCPSCVSRGWWTLTPKPQDRLQALVRPLGQWTAPLLVHSTSSSMGKHIPSTASDTTQKMVLAQSGGEMGGSRCPSPALPGHAPDQEDTFTLGGVYIGSLESHIRTHQAICSGLNYRSQGCQTGEMETSPPVIEWRMHPSASREELPQRPSLAHVGVQCMELLEDTTLRLQTSGLGQVEGDVCVRDARARLTGRTRVEAGRARPAFVMALVQAMFWLPLPIASLTLYLMPVEVGWAWQVMLLTLSFTSLAPALAPAAFIIAAR